MNSFKKTFIVFVALLVSRSIYSISERPLIFREGKAVLKSTRTMHRIFWYTFNSEIRESEICSGTESLLFMDKDLKYVWQEILPLITLMIYNMETVNFYCGKIE